MVFWKFVFLDQQFYSNLYLLLKYNIYSYLVLSYLCWFSFYLKFWVIFIWKNMSEKIRFCQKVKVNSTFWEVELMWGKANFYFWELYKAILNTHLLKNWNMKQMPIIWLYYKQTLHLYINMYFFFLPDLIVIQPQNWKVYTICVFLIWRSDKILKQNHCLLIIWSNQI